jgi:hypothetical protein
MATVKGNVTPNHVSPLVVDETAAVPLDPLPSRPETTQSLAAGQDRAATELTPSGSDGAAAQVKPPLFDT